MYMTQVHRTCLVRHALRRTAKGEWKESPCSSLLKLLTSRNHRFNNHPSLRLATKTYSLPLLEEPFGRWNRSTNGTTACSIRLPTRWLLIIRSLKTSPKKPSWRFGDARARMLHKQERCGAGSSQF